MVTAIEAVKGTYLLPRDLITAAMYGRTFVISIPGQRTLVPMAFRKDVSFSLDTVTIAQGGLLVRGAELWDPFPQGLPGQLLSSQGLALPPQWVNPQIIGADDMITSTDDDTITTSGAACLGNILTPPVQVNALQIIVQINKVVGGTYKVMMALMSGDLIGEILFDGPTIAPSGTGIEAFVFALPEPILMLAGQRYAILVVRTDGTGASIMGMTITADPIMGWIGYPQKEVAIASNNNPIVGTDLQPDVSGSPRGINLVYSF